MSPVRSCGRRTSINVPRTASRTRIWSSCPWQPTATRRRSLGRSCRCSKSVSTRCYSSRPATGFSKGARRDCRTCASVDSRSPGGGECAPGDLRERQLPLVHVVRGSEPVPVCLHELVSDDGGLAEGRSARRRAAADARHQSALTRQRSGATASHHRGMSVSQRFDALAFGAHPDDVEVAMGGTMAKLSNRGLTPLFVDLCDGEPTRYACAMPSRSRREARCSSRIRRRSRKCRSG